MPSTNPAKMPAMRKRTKPPTSAPTSAPSAPQSSRAQSSIMPATAPRAGGLRSGSVIALGAVGAGAGTKGRGPYRQQDRARCAATSGLRFRMTRAAYRFRGLCNNFVTPDTTGGALKGLSMRPSTAYAMSMGAAVRTIGSMHGSHDHAHGHSHAGHSHAPTAHADRRWLAVALALIAGVIAVEGVRRLGSPPDVDGPVVVVVGVLGAIVNVGAFWALSRSERQSLNVAGARAHVLADLYGSVAAIVAGGVIAVGGPAQADALAALTVAALMLMSAWSLLRASTRVLLEAAPAGLDPDEVGRTL